MSPREVVDRGTRDPADSLEDLRRERDALLDFVENATVPLHRVGPDGTILWANRAELETLGYERQEYIGHHIAEFHADRPVIEDILARLGRGEELHDYPARLLRKDGSIRHVLISSSVYFRDGEFVSTRCFTRDVTEQRLAEEKLRASVAFRRAIEEAAPAGLAACDVSGRQTYVNRAFSKLVGWDEEELVGAEPPFVYWPPEETQTIRQAFESTLRGEIPEEGFELRFQRRGGERFDALVLVSPIRDDRGEVGGWLASVSDISERKRTEERLARQTLEARLFHRATALAAETDSLEDALRSCVETVCELTGWPVGHVFVPSGDGRELLSSRVWHIRSPRRFASFRKITEETRFAPGVGLPGRIWESCEPLWIADVRREKSFVRAQVAGNLGVKGAFGFPIRIRGRTEAVLEFFHEEEVAPDEDMIHTIRSLGEQVGRVMERRRAAAEHARLYSALQEREAELRGIFENAAVGVAQLDLEGRWLMVNDRLCEILGRPRDEILTRNFRDFTHPDDLDENLRESRRLLEGESESYTLEKRYVRKGGEPVWVEATVSLSRDEENGEPRCFVAVVEDISESKRATEAIVFLAEASEILVSSLAYQETLPRIARLAVPALADWCAVDVVRGGRLERLALTHLDPARAEAFEELHRRDPSRADAAHGPPRVVREGASELVQDVTDELLVETAEDEAHLEFLRRLEMRSFLCVPLMVRGEPVGALTFASAESGRRYDEKDLALAEELARRAATAIDNARLYRAAQEEILERKRSEEALRENEERLRFTLDAVRVGTWDWDMRTGKVRWSENLEAIHGLRPGSFDGRFESFIEDVLPEDRTRVREALREALEKTGDYHVEYRLNRPGRLPPWVEGRGRVILDTESGKPTGMTGVCADITARKLAEESRARLAAIAESSSDAILGKSLDGIISEWNKGAEKMYGYTAEEAVGSPISMLVPPDRLGELSVIHDSLRRGERFEQYETVRLRKDGTALDVSLTVSPLRDSSGTVIGAATIARDITERKRYEAALERANQELQHKNQELEQFVYSVSHDLKSPLVTTIGFLGLLKEDLAAGRTDAVRDAMARIERAAQRMGRLIDDLLQLSRIGRLQNRPEEVDVTALVKEICEDLGPRIEECGAVIEIAGDMPRVVTDRARLGEVFENLLTNALKYGPDGSSPLKIEVGGRFEGGRARFHVRDNGAGIAPEYHERIFGLFERLHSREEGTGIGLAICRRIMEVGGGRLWVESEPGKGACFWLEFPAPSP